MSKMSFSHCDEVCEKFLRNKEGKNYIYRIFPAIYTMGGWFIIRQTVINLQKISSKISPLILLSECGVENIVTSQRL